jgi:starch phosphorylase
VLVYLGELDPEAVRAELYAEPQDGREPFRQPMNRGEKLRGPVNGFVYSASVPASRPANHYTPRLVPFKAGASVPLEAQFILWRDTPA